MTSSQRTVVLWGLAAALFVTSGLLGEPTNPLAVGTGLLFLIVGILTFAKGRGSASPRSR
jgi:hypothetical protein